MNRRKNLQALTAFVVGLLFALGLAISGMTQPQKVLGFLTIGSGWDPSLMFVMLGAIPVHALSYRWIRGKKSPLFDTKWHVPQNKDITMPLIVGSALFGVGWGLAGYCPGPALTSLGAGGEKVFYFVAAMSAGMLLYRLYTKVTS
ncbi:DUF6691 family protein [Bdellovibrio bacteriovorus]|uniref:DUF6691 family protein n=1 Tax=Bdellovibrio TaxID=958 RepID=UPI0035A82511